MSAQAWARFDRIAGANGGGDALVHGAARLSFSGLRAAALAWAGRLDAAPGARVIVSGGNGPVPAAAILGLWRRGAIPVLVHAEAPAQHLVHAARLTGAAAALLDADRAAPGLGVETIRLETPDAPATPLPAVPRQSGAEPASILFTSGSTGLPKGVVQSAATLIDGADRVAAHLGYRADDRILCAIPFAFDYGWGQLLSTLFRGLPLVLPEPRSAFGLCAALDAHRPSVLAGVPALFADLLSGLSPIRGADRASVRLITNTGSKIPAPVWEALIETFPDAGIALNYGLTETYRSASLPPRWRARTRTASAMPFRGSISRCSAPTAAAAARTRKARSSTAAPAPSSATGASPSARRRPCGPIPRGPTKGCPRRTRSSPATSGASTPRAGSTSTAGATGR